MALQTRGGELALSTTARCYGASLRDDLSALWETCYKSIRDSAARHPLGNYCFLYNHAGMFLAMLRYHNQLGSCLHFTSVIPAVKSRGNSRNSQYFPLKQ